MVMFLSIDSWQMNSKRKIVMRIKMSTKPCFLKRTDSSKGVNRPTVSNVIATKDVLLAFILGARVLVIVVVPEEMHLAIYARR